MGLLDLSWPDSTSGVVKGVRVAAGVAGFDEEGILQGAKIAKCLAAKADDVDTVKVGSRRE